MSTKTMRLAVAGIVCVGVAILAASAYAADAKSSKSDASKSASPTAGATTQGATSTQSDRKWWQFWKGHKKEADPNDKKFGWRGWNNRRHPGDAMESKELLVTKKRKLGHSDEGTRGRNGSAKSTPTKRMAPTVGLGTKSKSDANSRYDRERYAHKNGQFRRETSKSRAETGQSIRKLYGIKPQAKSQTTTSSHQGDGKANTTTAKSK